MSEAKCNKCGSFIIWIKLSVGWRPFDYGKKQAIPDRPMTSSGGELITSGMGFRSHFKTCNDRIRAKQAEARKAVRERQERKRLKKKSCQDQ